MGHVFRGLPVRIYRPALISGDSRTGAFNRDDILTTLIRGCVHMGAAPDLDWTLDTYVTRIAPQRAALSVEIPLVKGESVLTDVPALRRGWTTYRPAGRAS